MKTKFRAHPDKAGTAPGGDRASAPPGALLEARDVRKSYGRHEVLRGVDLAVGRASSSRWSARTGPGSPPC